ncbi:DUF1330 domain-containing protein [Meridianimarinicoccus sp. RP-17]|uniref:DUF1330 domain-containing protein n=1 Tax=Meridianimarinicoccus zhengii TaxID=2056810 RepID=UPI000DAB7BD8|nr:DUF1330 domain-containing protein [Phycocomes zhengii]
MSVLWISHVTVTDPERYGRYATLATEAIGAHGGVFLVRGGAFRQMEGPERPRNVVARFADMETAVACYNSDIYQRAMEHARGACERELVIVEELAP